MSKNDELFFDWTKEIEGYPTDCLDRAKYAKFLTNFLVSKGSNGSYVLNVNAVWGAGKTWFLRRWAEELKYKYPVVFVDAWKSDHSKDPFLSVISEIQTSLTTDSDKIFLESKIAKKGWMLLKGVAPELMKMVIKKASGIDADKIIDTLNNDENDYDYSELGGKLVETAIKVHNDTNKSIEDFKIAIAEWLDVVINIKNLDHPLFIFIDELDRCRPTYAIEMLENVKHIFNMEKVIFVIATDKEQLQHSIKAVYGMGFDSEKYLGRFFDRTVTLPRGNLTPFLRIIIENSEIIKKYIVNKDNHWFVTNSDEDCLSKYSEIFAKIAEMMEMDLRTVGQWLERLEAILSNSYEGIDIILLSYFLGFNCSKSSAYAYIKNSHNLLSAEAKKTIVDKMNVKDQNTLNDKVKFLINGGLLGDKFAISESGIKDYITNPYKQGEYECNIGQLFYYLYEIFFYENKKKLLITNMEGVTSKVRASQKAGKHEEFFLEVFKSVINKHYQENCRIIGDYFDLVELASLLK